MSANDASISTCAGIDWIPQIYTPVMTVLFRSKMNGTLLHIVSLGKKANFVRVTLVADKLEIELPESMGMKTFGLGSGINDGKWHKVRTVIF